jgi:cytochrome c553
MAQGYKQLKSNCTACHKPSPKAPSVIAPNLGMIKRAYTANGESLEEFTKNLSAFVANPDRSLSKMPEAIEKHGLMPQLGISEDILKNIALYLYQTPLEDTAWYESQYKNEKEKYSGNAQPPVSPLEKGKSYALQTKSVLGKNLLNALNTNGPANALAFCNTHAIPLTDSMAMAQGVQIKRVSDFNRNPTNAANSIELQHIAKMKDQLANGNKPQPQLMDNGATYTGYYPIMTNDMCLKCHGTPETDINTETLAVLRERYPNDKATGYAANELRGIWVVDFPK